MLTLAVLALAACGRQSGEVLEMPKKQAYHEALNTGLEALGANDYAKAEAAFGRQRELFPKDPTAPYNLACTYARQGDKARALEALEQSVALGWDDWEYIGQDTDLASLRGEPRFFKAVETVKARVEAFEKEWDPVLRADRQAGRAFKTVGDLIAHYTKMEKDLERATVGRSAFEQKERRYRLVNEKMGSLKMLDWRSDPQAFAEVLRIHRAFGGEAGREEGARLYEEFIAQYKDSAYAAEARYEHGAALARIEETRARGVAILEEVAAEFPRSVWGGRAMMTLAQEARTSGDLEKAYPYAKAVLERFANDREIGWQVGELRYVLYSRDGLPEPGVPDWDGKPVTLDEYKGKVLLLDFWATWCQPCVAEIPTVKAAHDKFHSKGLEVVSVSLDYKMDLDKLKKFCKEKGMHWRHIYENKEWKDTIAEKYYIHAIPTMILVDRAGKVHAGQRGEALLQQVEALIAE
jgi:thiol-disulfide isomerase/thioredoxin